jgi:hypothetical protein
MMAKTIWKFPIADMRGFVSVLMPEGAEILKAAMQHPFEICLWAKIDPIAPLVQRKFRIFSTGDLIDDDAMLRLIDVVIDNPYVWHVFEDTTPC